MIETSEDLPEPPEKDFWEGGAWEVSLHLAFLSIAAIGLHFHFMAWHSDSSTAHSDNLHVLGHLNPADQL